MYDNNYSGVNNGTEDNAASMSRYSTTPNQDSTVQNQDGAVQNQDTAVQSQATTMQNQDGVRQNAGMITQDQNSMAQRNPLSWNQGAGQQNRNTYGAQAAGGYNRSAYQNGTYAQNMAGTPYENRGAGTYHYGNTYPNDFNQAGNQAGHKKAEKKPHKFGFVKKALVCVSLGLMFGVFAGLGLYGVQYVTGALDGKTDSSDTAKLETMAGDVEKTDGEAAKKSGDAIAESGIHVTDSLSTVVADVSNVVKEVMPSIVSINNHFTEKVSYFGQTLTSEADSSGSGIIVGQNDTELLIVTNYHVIQDTDKLTVQFVEGSEAEASVKGTDAGMDLAVIAVPISSVEGSTMDEIAIATLGDSDALVVGEPAIAIGNSLGYGQSVTTGVISALDRSIELSEGSEGTFIQTDAAINPGNSGGALLNMKGEVIGINSNKIGGSVVEGMGYAIPISAASPIIAELMLKETKNKVAEEERGYLGIAGITVIPYLIETYGMPEGVYISQVYENTAAEQAGLHKGDIITEFNGEKVASMEELMAEMEFYAKGTTVNMTVVSPGNNGYEEKTVQITLGNKVE